MLEVRFDEPAALGISIADYATSEHKDTLRIQLYGQSGQFGGTLQTPTPEGTCEFRPLQPGGHSIVVLKTDGKYNAWPIARRDADLIAGENEISVAIPRLHTFEVEIAPGSGRTVALMGREINRFVIRRGVPKDGIVRFPWLRAGDYELYCDGEQYAVTVPHRGRFRVP